MRLLVVASLTQVGGCPWLSPAPTFTKDLAIVEVHSFGDSPREPDYDVAIHRFGGHIVRHHVDSFDGLDVVSCCLTPAGELAAITSDGQLQIIDLDSGSVLDRSPISAYSIRWSHDGARVATVADAGGQCLLEIRSPNLTVVDTVALPLTQPFTRGPSISWAPDDDAVVISNNTRLNQIGEHGAAIVDIATLAVRTLFVTDAQFIAADRVAAVFGAEAIVGSFDLQSSEDEPDQVIPIAAFSEDSTADGLLLCTLHRDALRNYFVPRLNVELFQPAGEDRTRLAPMSGVVVIEDPHAFLLLATE